jgi:hypothetical protein
VLHQSKGHWLLSNALTIAITLIVNMEPKLLQLSSPSKVSDPFEVEILLLHRNMQLEVIKVINPFLDFLRSIDARQVHNMIIIMLDTHFKALRIVESLVGCKNAIQLTFEYDAKVVILLLMVCFERLNPIDIAFATTTNDVRLKFEENMFGWGLN